MKKLFSIVLASCLLFSNSAMAIQFSDNRYMEDVTAMTNCKAQVLATNPVRYHLMGSSSGFQMGFYGQELRDALSSGSPLVPIYDTVVSGVYVDAPADPWNDVDPLQIDSEQLVALLACAQKNAFAEIDTKSPLIHAHAASDVTTGTFADARIAASNVTQHQAALSIASSQVSGLTAAARSAISVTGNGSYNSSTGVITVNSPSSRVFNNNVSRTLNSSYTVSSTRDASVSYSINVSWNIGALLSGSAVAYLEYSTDSGTTWTTVNQVSKNIGLLTFAGNDDLNLVGNIPANATTRIRVPTPTNMTVTYVRGQEVLQ